MRRLAALWLLLALGLACAREGPEAQVKKAFRACVAALEAGEAGPAIERLAPEFRGPQDMDRNAAKLYLLALLQREKVGITVLEERTEAEGTEGVQEVQLLLTSRGGTGLLPQDASRRHFLLRWVKREGKWLLKELQE